MKNQKQNHQGKWQTTVALGLTLVSASFAQTFPRQATMVGGGGPDRGKCTIEVVVDGAAEVEVRGTSAILRNLSGAPATWRRFECTGALPQNPAEFRFAGVDGRGRQTLIRDPRNGGVAVVQIEDKDNGSEGYTFDLFWGGYNGGGGGGYSEAPRPQVRRDDQPYYRPNYRDSDYYRRYRHGFGVDQAVSLCQQSVLATAQRRFRNRDIHINRISIDDGPGRADWVVGTLDVPRRDHEERFRFSCSVDFESGRIRTADIEPRPLDDDPRWHQ